MGVTSYSRTAASNTSAPPNGAPEGMAPSAVNDVLRQVMADAVQEATKGQARVLSSVSGTNTITATMTPDLDAYTAGMIVVFTPANTNTGATTLNIDSIGALDVFNADGSALLGGELVSGTPVVAVLDSGADDWIIVGQKESSGSYTATISSGLTTTPTFTMYWKKRGTMISQWSRTQTTGTGNSTGMAISGMPSGLYPVSQKIAPLLCIDNGVQGLYSALISTAGEITIQSPSMTSSGTKGVQVGTFFSYDAAQ